MDPQPIKQQNQKKKESYKKKVEINQQTIFQLILSTDRQILRNLISSHIKTLTFKQTDDLRAALKESLNKRYYKEQGKTCHISLMDQLLQNMKEVNGVFRELQVASPIIDVFFSQYFSLLKDFKLNSELPPSLFLSIWQDIPFRNLKDFLIALKLEEDYRNISEEEMLKVLIGLLNDQKIQQCCTYYLNYHTLPEFQTIHFAPKLAISSQVYSAQVLKILRKKPNLKEQVIKIIDLSKAVPLLQNLEEDPRDYEAVNTFILRKHFLSMTHEYKEWFVFEDKMSFHPLFIEFYCSEKQDLDEDIRYSLLVRNNLKEQEKDRELVPNPLFEKDEFNITEVILKELKEEEEYEQYLRLQSLGVKRENVYFVQATDCEIFDRMTEDLFSSHCIGFDAENRCTATKFEQQGVSLIQLSNSENSYVIDFMKLERDEKFINFFFQLLSSSQHKKIGHTIQSDIRFLEKTINIDASQIRNFQDLSKIFKAKFPNELQNSLAFMCDKILGKKLSKYEQRSNWNRRPLKQTQLHYAALDAFVCLKLYECLSDKDLTLKQGTANGGKQNKKVQDEIIRGENLIYAKNNEWLLKNDRPKFMIDSMLKKLCSMMRNLGIDCEYMNVSNFEIMKEMAEKEERIILTRDTKLLKKKIHKSPIYCIVEKGDSDKMFEEVRKEFNLDLSLFKPLSRCVKCNCGELEVIGKEEAMKSIVFQYEGNSIQQFWRCVKCKQIYWEGNQFHKAKDKFEQMK